MPNFSVRFETAQHIPPPFCNHYQFDISTLDSNLSDISFSLNYHHRDQIDIEEIYDEGFTEADDCEWKGQLGESWTSAFQDFFNKVSFETAINTTDDSNLFEVKIGNDWCSVENQHDSELFFQEVIQAVFETSSRESPLVIYFLELNTTNQKTEIDLVISFAKRTFLLTNEQKSVSLQWSDLNTSIQKIYECEFIEEQASRKKPSKVGKYLHLGDGNWYQFGKSLQNSKGKTDSLDAILEIFNKFNL